MALAGTAVKDEALRLALDVFQPDDINSAEAVSFLRHQAPDLFITAAYGQIFSGEVLSIPGIIPVNLHPSLLPKYRGAAPLNWALINGESSTGVSVVRMVRKMDAGPVLRSVKAGIGGEDDAVSLGERLSAAGAELLVETLRAIEKGDLSEVPQNDKEATFAPLLKKEDGRIDWNKTSVSIHDLVRGCAGWPGTFSYFRGKAIKIIKTETAGAIAAGILPGKIISATEKGLEIACGKGMLRVKTLQPESKKEMTAREFINGYNPLAEEHFTSR